MNLCLEASEAGVEFDLFGSFTSSADVSVSATLLLQSKAATAPGLTCCDTTNPVAPCLTAHDSGTASASVQTISTTFGGNTYTVTLTAVQQTTCTVTAGGTLYVELSGEGASRRHRNGRRVGRGLAVRVQRRQRALHRAIPASTSHLMAHGGRRTA